MECLEFQRHLVYPRAPFLHTQRVVQLCVEGQHVQVHFLTIYVFHRIHHVLNKLGVRRSCRMHPDHHLWLLGLFLVSPFGAHLFTIGVDGIAPHLVGSDYRCCKQLKEPGCKRLSTGRVANDQSRTVQPAQLLWSMVESVGASGHQRHLKGTSHKQRCWILIPFQALADVTEHRKVVKQRFYLCAPHFQLRLHLTLVTY